MKRIEDRLITRILVRLDDLMTRADVRAARHAPADRREWGCCSCGDEWADVEYFNACGDESADADWAACWDCHNGTRTFRRRGLPPLRKQRTPERVAEHGAHLRSLSWREIPFPYVPRAEVSA